MTAFATDSVAEVVRRQRERLLAREEAALRSLSTAYARLGEAVAARAGELAKRIAAAELAGVEPSPTWAERTREYQALQSQASELAARYGGRAFQVAEDRQKAATLEGRADSEALVRATSVRAPFRSLRPEAFEDLWGRLQDGSPLKDLFDGFAGGASQAVRDALLQGFGLGLNPRELGRTVAGLVQEKLEAATLRRAVLIARDQSLAAYAAAASRNYEANSDVVTGMIVQSALDARVCPVCAIRHGTILPVGAALPRHAACRCILRPIVDGFDPPTLTGEEWVASLPEVRQRALLGPGRYELWKERGVPLRDMVEVVEHPKWGPTARLRTIESVKAGEGPTVSLPAAVRARVNSEPGGQRLLFPTEDTYDVAGLPRTIFQPGGARVRASADEITARLFSGPADVRLDDKAEAFMRGAFPGVDPRLALQELMGAPAGAEVYAYGGERVVQASLEHPWFEAFERTIGLGADGRVHIKNEYLVARRKGEFLGNRAFAREAAAARVLGVKSISALCARTPDFPSGYKVWAALGYNGRIPVEYMSWYAQDDLVSRFKGAATVQDILAQPDGWDWWVANGETFSGYFEPGGRSFFWMMDNLKRNHIKFDDGPLIVDSGWETTDESLRETVARFPRERSEAASAARLKAVVDLERIHLQLFGPREAPRR